MYLHHHIHPRHLSRRVLIGKRRVITTGTTTTTTEAMAEGRVVRIKVINRVCSITMVLAPRWGTMNLTPLAGSTFALNVGIRLMSTRTAPTSDLTRTLVNI
jgi:hypothetical protein